MKIFETILNYIPMFFRDKWPMRSFYWQKKDTERVEQKVKKLLESIRWE